MTYESIKGNYCAKGFSFAIISANFNKLITQNLVQGSLDCLTRHGADTDKIQVFEVPGAFEISILAAKLAASNKFDAIICNGAVIRGETAHFDQIVNAVTSGLNQVAINNCLPIGNGVLTTDTVEQALNRAGIKAGNKGFEAALSTIEMLNIFKQI